MGQCIQFSLALKSDTDQTTHRKIIDELISRRNLVLVMNNFCNYVVFQSSLSAND